MTIAIDQFPPAIAPHAKRIERFHGNGITCPVVGGWAVDGRAVSYDEEAHTWLKANGFTHHGRRWLRADDAEPLVPSSKVKVSRAMERALRNVVAGRCASYGLSGRSQMGGLTRTLYALRQAGFMDMNGDVTEAGRAWVENNKR